MTNTTLGSASSYYRTPPTEPRVARWPLLSYAADTNGFCYHKEKEMVNAMEWERQVWQQNGGNAEMMYVKVMTDEQLETLRKQIAVYATLCDQLVQMHKNLSAHQDLTGVRLGSVYCDPLMGPGGHKLTSRQRWTPTAAQLQILERIFDQGTGTPSKEKIKEITAELSEHGQISETNVYNWFQNRRARSKRKQQIVQPATKTETEVEPQDDSKDKKSSPRELPSLPADNLCFPNPDVCSNLYLDPESNKLNSVFPLDASLTATRNFDDVPVFNGMLSNSDDDDYLTGKMDEPESYNLYQQASDYNMVG